MNILRSVLVFALFQVYSILIPFFCNKILIFAQIFQMLFKHILLCNHTMRRLQDCSMSLLVMTGYVVNKALLFLQFHLLPLRHVNTFLSRSMNIQQLPAPMAREHLIMKHLLENGTKQLMGRRDTM
jgi:hypothetical protein